MKECPELKDLAHFVETGEGRGGPQGAPRPLRRLPGGRANLEDEAMSLQISISELWFREQISCPDAPTLEGFRKKTLGAEEQAYVEFHLETLECPTCQARMGEAELAQSPRAAGSPTRSGIRDARSLIGDLRKGAAGSSLQRQTCGREEPPPAWAWACASVASTARPISGRGAAFGRRLRPAADRAFGSTRTALHAPPVRTPPEISPLYPE